MPLAQGNNTLTRPRIEPGSPDPESDTLTTRPVRPRTTLCLYRVKCNRRQLIRRLKSLRSLYDVRLQCVMLLLKMSLNFGQIRQLITELAALGRLINQCLLFSQFLFKLAGTCSEGKTNIFNEFKFRPDWTTHNRVSCH